MREKHKPNVFSLDKDRLDEEWEEQPRMYHHEADILVEAQDSLERAEAALELLAAQLDKEIRENPEKFGMDKPTEPAIKLCIIRRKAYQKQLHYVLDCKHAVNKAKKNTTTLEHRKRALEKLVDLRLNDYYAEPRLPKGSVRGETDRILRKQKKLKRREGSRYTDLES